MMIKNKKKKGVKKQYKEKEQEQMIKTKEVKIIMKRTTTTR